jgi:hypothetical protein
MLAESTEVLECNPSCMLTWSDWDMNDIKLQPYIKKAEADKKRYAKELKRCK